MGLGPSENFVHGCSCKRTRLCPLCRAINLDWPQHPIFAQLLKHYDGSSRLRLAHRIAPGRNAELVGIDWIITSGPKCTGGSILQSRLDKQEGGFTLQVARG